MNVGHLEIDDFVLRAFCEKWGVAELAVFGSVLRDDFRPDSDIDFLVTWALGVRRTWKDIWAMKLELEATFGREVGIAQRHVVEIDHNPIRRKNILSSARTLYAAA
ncbi:MAG: nucleotidyltransferase domain-containing protein [bacterium]